VDHCASRLRHRDVIVFLAAPMIRTVARIDMPSTRHPMICPRRSVLSLFILTVMLDRSRTVKGTRKNERPRSLLYASP
jgi:hypothetical protein